MGLVWVIWFIFSNSMQVGADSSTASGRVLLLLQELLRRLGRPGLAARLTEHMVRKGAHFCEYMLEGFFLLLCLRAFSGRLLRYISWPILLGLLTAVCDETIQIFTYGRESRLQDVWIDFGGVLTGILIGTALVRILDALNGRRLRQKG